MNEEKPTPKKPRMLSVALSVIAAAFGVQSSKNRERDFQHHSFVPYIIGGIVFTVLFIGTVVLVVKTVLRHAAG